MRLRNFLHLRILACALNMQTRDSSPKALKALLTQRIVENIMKDNRRTQSRTGQAFQKDSFGE